MTVGGPPGGGFGMGLTIPHCKNKLVMKHHKEPQTWMVSLDKQPKRRNMDMRFGTWEIRSLYRVGCLMTVSRELSRYMLGLVGGLEGSGTTPAREYTCFSGKGHENHEECTGFFVHKRIISTVTWVKFLNDRMSYISLRGRWFHIIVLNVHSPTEDEIGNVKDVFYEELERIFNKFPKYLLTPWPLVRERTILNMKNGVFWVVTPCGSCKNRRFGGTWRLHQGDKNRRTRNNTSCN
jgi:hypothetical protein